MSDEAPITTVLFDLDGTLIDARPAILASHRHAFREVAGIDIEEVGYDEGALLAMRIPEAFEYMGYPELGNEGSPVYDHYYRDQGFELAEVYETTSEMLAALSDAGYRWGVVTNKGRGRATTDLERLIGPGALGRLSAFVTAENTPERKPHPAPILAGLQEAGVDAAEAMYVGDGPHDVEAAIAAGVMPVGAGYGYYEHDVLADAGAATVLDDPLDLLDFLDARGVVA